MVQLLRLAQSGRKATALPRGIFCANGPPAVGRQKSSRNTREPRQSGPRLRRGPIFLCFQREANHADAEDWRLAVIALIPFAAMILPRHPVKSKVYGTDP
jgi:hypothetical protein